MPSCRRFRLRRHRAAATLRTTGLERVGKVAQDPGDGAGLHRAPHFLALLLASDHASLTKDGEVTRDDRQIDPAALRDLTDGARLSLLRQAHEQ